MVSTDKTEAVIGAPSAAQVEVADARLVIGQGIGPEVKMLYVVSLISSAWKSGCDPPQTGHRGQ